MIRHTLSTLFDLQVPSSEKRKQLQGVRRVMDLTYLDGSHAGYVVSILRWIPGFLMFRHRQPEKQRRTSRYVSIVDYNMASHHTFRMADCSTMHTDLSV